MQEDPSTETSPSIHRRLLDLAAPIIGLNVLNVLALAVDTAMLGRVPDAEVALTGMGFASQLIFLLMVAMMGLTVGTVAFVARAHGAGESARVVHILRQSSQLTLLLGLAVGVLGNLVGPWLMLGLGADEVSLQAGLDYLRPMLLGSVFSYLNILLAAILRGVGNTRLPFVVALMSNALNVVLNYGLILGNWGLPALGIQGAAIGTVLSQGFAVVTLVSLLRRGAVDRVTVPLSPARLDTGLARDLVRIGTPAAMDMLVLNASFLSIVGMLGRIDPLAVAAHGVGLRVQALAFVPGMSISQATGALVGQALGAGDVARARAVLRAAVAQCTAVMTVLALALIAGAAPIIQLFDIDPTSALGDYSLTWMRLLGFCMPVVGTYIAMVGLFQGAGATRLSLRINIVATLIFQIPMSYVLGFPMGLSTFGVWLAFPLAFVVKSGMGLMAYRKESWAQVGARV